MSISVSCWLCYCQVYTRRRQGSSSPTTIFRTQGRPISAVEQGLRELQGQFPADAGIRGVCITGSACYLGGEMASADIVKNEITAQAMAALQFVLDARTAIEIGGKMPSRFSSATVWSSILP